jgi:hypothetical protein
MKKEGSMNTGVPAESTAAQVQTTDTNAALNERQRIGAILALTEAENKSTLAKHLAFETDMTVDAAKAILSAAGSEVAAKVEATQPVNQFVAAMNTSDNPNIGAESSASEQTEVNDPIQAIVSAHIKATGRK